jgi:hypothetical protein
LFATQRRILLLGRVKQNFPGHAIFGLSADVRSDFLQEPQVWSMDLLS